ncbi:MAG: DMT family transporter [Pseudomonadota bacterium]
MSGYLSDDDRHTPEKCRNDAQRYGAKENRLGNVIDKPTLPSRVANLSALTALIFWGGTAITNKSLLDFLAASDIAIVRTWLAGVFAAVLIGLSKTRRPESGTRVSLLISYAISIFVFWPLLLSAGLARTSASHAAIIMAFLPILTIIVSSIVSGVLPDRRWWLGSAVATLAAFIFLINPWEDVQANSRSSLAGDLIVLTGCVFAAVGYVLGGRVSNDIGARAATMWGLVIGMLCVTPLGLWFGTYAQLSGLPAVAWANLIWLSVLSSFLAYLLWYHASALIGINRVGTMLLLLPVITLLGANAVLAEPLSLQLIAGCIAVVMGTYYAHKYAT